MNAVRTLMARPWIWSFVAAFAVWVLTVRVVANVGGGGLTGGSSGAQ